MPAASPPGRPPPRDGVSAELLARVPKLLGAMRSVGTGLELHSTLNRICETAADLADARYAAIGVVAEDGDGLADFVHHGIDEATARRIGHLPDGRKGLLGALIRDPEPVRLTDLAGDRLPACPGHPDRRGRRRGGDPAGRAAGRTVADDGVGIPEGGRRSGPHNLRRRAETLGGVSRVGPGIGVDGGGTTVLWEAPC